MRRMILLFAIGAFLVYALAFMAFLVGLMAVVLSLGIYALMYAGMYLYARVAGTVAPRWGWNAKIWFPSRDFIQGTAIFAGTFSLAGMVVCFIAYAVTQDLADSIGVAVAFLAIAGLYGLVEVKGEKDREEISRSGSEPKS